MRYLIMAVLLFAGSGFAKAQSDSLTADKALQKVFDVLSGDERSVVDTPQKFLQKGAWEALAYIEEAAGLKKENIAEAVPDYYHFYDKEVLLKLIDPEDYNQYGQEMRVDYAVKEKKILLLKDGKQMDSWDILYLDKSYMALDMGELRVFFTHTAPQE